MSTDGEIKTVTVSLTAEQVKRLDELAQREMRTREAQAAWVILSALEAQPSMVPVGRAPAPRVPAPRGRPRTRDQSPCLAHVAGCKRLAIVRGVCMRHRNMAFYFCRNGNLDEGWLVRHGRLLPGMSGMPAAHEVKEPVLPRARLLGEEKLWLFGLFPEAVPVSPAALPSSGGTNGTVTPS